MNSKVAFKLGLAAFVRSTCVAATASLGLLVFSSFVSAQTLRDHYSIVLKGIQPLRGSLVRGVQAYVWRAKEWSRIPLQIDEVNQRGDFVLDSGLPFTKATDDGVFDENDELVLWGGDLGDDFLTTAIPGHLRAFDNRKLWKVQFRRAGREIGYALIVADTKHSPPLEGPPDVSFTKEKDGGVVLRSGMYEYRFSKKNPALLGEVLLTENGRRTAVIKDSQFIMPLVTPWYIPNLSFNGSDFESSIESWQVGPLRTIVAVGVKYSSFLSLFKLHLFSELVFYRNQFEIPTVIEFVFDPSKYLYPGSGLAYVLTFAQTESWKIESNLAPLPLMAMDEIAANGVTAAATDLFHARGSSTDGAFYVQVRVDAAARREVPPPFLFQKGAFEDASLKKKWPWLDKLNGDLGVYLDFAGVKVGTYDFGLDLFLSSKAHESFADYGFVDADWQVLTPGLKSQ